jgi:hypothetical protein
VVAVRFFEAADRLTPAEPLDRRDVPENGHDSVTAHDGRREADAPALGGLAARAIQDTITISAPPRRAR